MGSSPAQELMREVACGWAVPELVPSAVWIPKHVVFPKAVSAMDGLWASEVYPYLTGPLEAFDDATVERITLCCATRTGKTSIMQAEVCYIAANDPAPVMIVAPDERKAKGLSRRLQLVLEATPATSDLLPPPRFRNWSELKLANGMMIYFAWSGSATTLGDRAIKYAFAVEIDKYTRNASLEADPLELAEERVKGYPGSKFCEDSTPTILGRSRIWGSYLDSDQRRYFVPCPHCGEMQVLEMGRETPGGRFGLVFQGDNPNAVRHSTRYVCRFCFRTIEPFDRPAMLKNGVWTPLTPHPSPHTPHVGFQLSSHYATLTTWGQVAAKFVRAKGQPARLQNFINAWLSEPWSLSKKQTTAQEVAERLGVPIPAGVVPDDAVFLTAGVDLQPIQGLFVWLVMAWGATGRCWIIDYGISDSFEALEEDVVNIRYETADRKKSFPIALALVDSGFMPDPVIRWCAKPGILGRVVPLKGTGDLTTGRPYELRPYHQTKGANRLQRAIREARGLNLALVSRDFFESWLQDRLENKKAGDPGALHLCREAAVDGDFLDQLLNGALVLEQDTKRGRDKYVWQRVRLHDPDDYRAACRYGAAAAEVRVRGRWHRVGRKRSETPTRPAPASTGDRRADGGRGSVDGGRGSGVGLPASGSGRL